MSLFQIAVGLLLLASWVARPLLYKPAAKYFKPEVSSLFTSCWLLVGLIITFPFLGHLLDFNNKNVLFSPYILISIYKGVTLFYLISMQQAINKNSTSSSVFLGFIALALGALVNNLFFHENLGLVKVICIVCFGILGFLFLQKGDAKRLSHKDLYYFIIVAIIMASYTVADHLAIPRIGWYAHLLVSSIAMFLTSIIYKASKETLKVIFTNKIIIVAGIFYTLSEFFVIYASFNILPVSIVAVFLRLSTPIIMVISAIKYKEQDVKNQLGFGIAAIILALPIILG
ncbi:MAG: hypothetical protein J6K16_00240 [Alphaproteobacteria bacterium]|nr:hypothetical protein [Alphaproteobacteria bacterium]